MSEAKVRASKSERRKPRRAFLVTRLSGLSEPVSIKTLIDEMKVAGLLSKTTYWRDVVRTTNEIIRSLGYDIDDKGRAITLEVKPVANAKGTSSTQSEAKGPYRTGYERGYYTVIDGSGVVVYSDSEVSGVNMFADAANYAHHHALAAQAERVKKLEADCEWLRSQWERHRKALNAIAWGEYDNVAFCRRLAQDELAIGVKVANDRASATVAALTPPAKGGT